jgi:cysteinyl-tRNA synthetase
MAIQIHDSLTRSLRPLEPLEPGLVRMYVCGPTVYDDCHIGHLMGPVIFDAIARWLRARGFRVRFVNNITDIDDKIIRRAQATGESWRSIAERYTEQYMGFLRELSVVSITDFPRCTDHVPQMIRFIEELVATDRAYRTPDGVYFDVLRQDGYGKLSGRRVDEMIAGARVEAQDALRHPADFALWKAAKPGEPSWDGPFGPGRPGWHIECSVMASELLGPSFDVHGGGDDLKFPHHENEIAQSEAHGDPYARTWMHHGLIQYGGKKIAKSDPRMQDPDFARQFQARWLLDHHGAPALRFFLLRGHYRRPIDFEPQNLEAARTGLIRLVRQLGALADEAGETGLDAILAAPLPAAVAVHRERFCAAMDEDFGTGEAIAELFSIAHAAGRLEGAERDAALRLLRDLGRLLGLFQVGDLARLTAGGRGGAELAPVVEALLAVRRDARARKDFATGDAIRDALQGLGIAVLDGAAGSTFEVQGRPAEDLLARVLDAALALRQDARRRRDFGTADGLRDRLAAAGVKVLDSADGSVWEL